MKRICYFYLAVLLGLCCWNSIIFAYGASANARPFTALAWGLDELSKDKPCMVSPYRNITMFYWLKSANSGKVAQAKKYLDEQPDGRRAIFDWDVHRIMYKHPADKLATESGEKFTAPWWNNGIAEAEKKYDEFFGAYKAMGGKLDYFMLDIEHTAGSDITSPEQWKAVEKDQRFAAVLNDLKMKSAKEIYEAKRPFAWWSYSGYLSGQYANRLYTVVKKYFPDVKCSDYGGWYNSKTDLVAWGVWEHTVDVPGRYGFHVGTHQSPSLYGVITYLGDKEVDGKRFGLGPFRSMMLASNYARAAVLSSDVPFMPWIAWRGYVSDFTKQKIPPPYCSFGNTDYYQESVFHTAMCNPDAFLLWSAFRWQTTQDPKDWCSAKDLQQIDDMLDQLNHLAGYTDRTTLVSKLSPWHAPYLLSGIKANGRSVWRLTPDPEQSPVALDKIMKSDNPLTFAIGNATLVMPGAKIYTTEKNLSSAGYWIIGTADLQPVENGR